MEYTFTTDNFEAEVLGSDVPVLVDFWATWCMPCRMLAPVIEEIASENEGKIKVGKVNVDENPDLARKYRVMSIPTVLVFKNGELTATSVGVDSKENILKLLTTEKSPGKRNVVRYRGIFCCYSLQKNLIARFIHMIAHQIDLFFSLF